MERCLHYVRLFPGTEAKFDRLHAEIPPRVAEAMAGAGLHQVTVFRRGTDVWRYAEAEPDRETAFERYRSSSIDQARRQRLRTVIASPTPPDGPIWYDEVFHTDAPAPAGPWQRGCFSLVIDPLRAADYDALHADPWPEMIAAIHAAGYRDYSGFRRGAHVVYVGRYYPDMETVIRNIDATEVAARWGKAFEGIITTFTDADGRLFRAEEIYHVE